MDLNGDGLQDALFGSFSGVPQWSAGAADGFGEPGDVTDKNGNKVLIADFWNFETEAWDKTDRAGTEGHCSSSAAVDWDNDGDQDLLLGAYRTGKLFLRLNEGSAADPKFAETNQTIEAGGKPVAFEHGMGAPRVVDWNGDGLFDIVIGSIYGGVYLLDNTGTQGAPRFEGITTLIPPLPGDAGSKQIKLVDNVAGQPSAPGSSFHVEPVDYDGDGDLDLLVGGRSKWLTGPKKEPTAEELAHAESLSAESDAAWEELREYKKTVEGEAALKELSKTEKYRGLLDVYRTKRAEARAVTADPIESGDFLWLFRRK